MPSKSIALGDIISQCLVLCNLFKIACTTINRNNIRFIKQWRNWNIRIKLY